MAFFNKLEMDIIFDCDSSWLFHILSGLIVICTIYFVLGFMIKKRSKKLEKQSKHMARLDQILMLPIRFVCIGLGVYYTVQVVCNQFHWDELGVKTGPYIKAYLMICSAWVAIRWKKTLVHRLQYHPKFISSGLGHTFGKVLSIIIFVVTALGLLHIFQLNIWPLLAFGGIGAAAVGFAAKDVISNFCGGLMLSITRPFVVGDQVIIPSLSLEGPVEEIGWYLTIVRDKDKRPVYLPNAVFSNAIVINSSRMTHRRILDQIALRFSDFHRLHGLNEKIRSYLKSNEMVDREIEPLVFLHSFKEGNLSLYLDFYVFAVKLKDYHAVKDEIYSHIYTLLEQEEVKMAITTFAIESMPSDFKL